MRSSHRDAEVRLLIQNSLGHCGRWDDIRVMHIDFVLVQTSN